MPGPPPPTSPSPNPKPSSTSPTPPFNAKGDGITDDTHALRRALLEVMGTHCIHYLPNGSYLVSKTLNIGKVHGSAGVTPDDSPGDRAAKVEKAHKTTVALLDRLQMLGFNFVRLWAGFNEPTDYTPGDGSPADDTDYFLARRCTDELPLDLVPCHPTPP